jgi:hypothetical protein
LFELASKSYRSYSSSPYCICPSLIQTHSHQHVFYRLWTPHWVEGGSFSTEAPDKVSRGSGPKTSTTVTICFSGSSLS